MQRHFPFHLFCFTIIFEINSLSDCIYYELSLNVDNPEFFYLSLIELGVNASIQIMIVLVYYLTNRMKKPEKIEIFHQIFFNLTLIISTCEFQNAKSLFDKNRNGLNFALILGILISTTLTFVKNPKHRIFVLVIEIIYLLIRFQPFIYYNLQKIGTLGLLLTIYSIYQVFFNLNESKQENNEKESKTMLVTEFLKECNEIGIALFDSNGNFIMKNKKITKIIKNCKENPKKILMTKLRFFSVDKNIKILEKIQIKKKNLIASIKKNYKTNSIEESLKNKKDVTLEEIMLFLTDFLQKNNEKLEKKVKIFNLTFNFSDEQDNPDLLESFHNYRLILTVFLKHNQVNYFLIQIPYFLDQNLLLSNEKKLQNNKIFHVSHEMRTPLNCILSMLQMLKPEIDQELAQEFITPSIISCNFLLYLVQDLLDMAQIDSNKFTINYEEFDLRIIISDIIQLFILQVDTKNAEIVEIIANNIPETIISDHRRIRQILINLIGNALKFLPKKNGKITIEAKLIDKNISLSVADNGIGIKDEDKKKLFQAFGKINNEESKKMNTNGIGLGLMISNNLAINLHPKKTEGLQVQSEYGVGTMLSFIIENKSEVFNFTEFDGFIKPNENYKKYQDNCQEKRFLVNEVTETKEIKLNFEKYKNKTEIFPTLKIKNGLFNEQQSNYVQINKDIPLSNKMLKSYKSYKSYKSFSKKSQISYSSNSDSSPPHNFCDMLLTKKNNEVFEINQEKLILIKEAVCEKLCHCPDILIVDDNAFNLYSLRKQLESIQFIIDSANSGEEAVELVQEFSMNYKKKFKCCNNYKIIFMDIEMPGKDGYETSMEIRKILQNGENINNDLIIIACSAHLFEETVDKYKLYGIDEFVTKPIIKERLILLLGKYIKI